MKNTLCLSIALGLAGAAAAQDIPLIINGPLTDDITNRANDITFIFTSSGQSPAANVGWGTNPPDSFRLTLDLSNSKSFPSYYSVQLFKGVDPAIYTPGPFVRMRTPYTLVIPGGFGYQLQKGVTYRLGLYDVAIIDRPDAATEDVIFKYEEQDSGGTGGGIGGGGGGGGGGEVVDPGGGGSGGGGSEVVPPGTGNAIGLLGLLPVDAIVSGLLPRNVDANPATAQRLLDEMMHAVLYDAGGTRFEEPTREWSTWLRAYGGSMPGEGGKLYQNGWEGLSGGLALGVERQFGAHGSAGLFASYARMDVRHEGLGGGHWFPDAVGGGLYARWDDSTWFLGAAVAGQFFDGEQTRGISYPGQNLTARGDRSASAFTAAIQAGARLKTAAGFVFTPSLLADWSIIEEDGFTESGADIHFGGRTFKFSNLEYEDRSTQWLSTDLGVTISRPTMLGQNRLTPSVRVAWRAMWQVEDDSQRIGYRFTGRTLDVDGSWEDQQNLGITGALDFATAGGVSFYVRGEALVIGEGSFNASAGVSLRF